MHAGGADGPAVPDSDAILVRMARLNARRELSTPAILRETTRLAAGAIEVARSSVWIFSADQRRLRCLHLYERTTDAHSSGVELEADRYPSYFAALHEARQIDAADAVADPRTREFASTYLEPLTIGAMLDAPIRIEGELRGVVCFEHIGGTRTWRDDEKAFASAVADIVALALETEQLRATRASLRQSEERFRALFECAPLGMMLLAPDGTIELHNPAMRHLLDLTPAGSDDASYLSHVAPADVERVRQCLGDAHACVVECASVDHRVRTGSASLVEVRLTVAPVTNPPNATQLVAIVENVSAIKRTERVERQARQRETIGRLASGVAHDFRNVLTSLRLTAQTMLESADESSPWRGELEEVERDTARATELVRQLLALGREDENEPRAVNLAALLRDAQGMFERLCGETVRVDLQLQEPLPPVHADPGQLQRVVMNLVTNARDAMPGGGTVTIIARAPDESGDVVLEVRDTGEGLDPAAGARIFEPFFSTKVLGKGTGLGLAIAQSIVERSGGRIEAESGEEGTVFRVFLPVAAAT